MIQVYKFEDETEEKCRLKCLDELDVYNNEILTKEYEEDNKYIMEVVKKVDVENFIKDYLTNITSKMGINAKINIIESDNIFSVKMFSDSNAILIGKDGKNLSSLQSLIRQTLSNMVKFNIKVNLDASNYKEKKERYFEADIKKIINEVMSSKDEIKLDPMNSYNRRLVHSIASEYYNIETESFGEEPDRYVVIRYVEK
ncbi:MAG: R3H domain-containing nucleic acid-binding protein [bacterium]|nr:R3H domain-containing nucleic acid-binding protein [bacterium]